MGLVKDASLMFRKNTWPNVRVTEVEVALHNFGYRAPHRSQLCIASLEHQNPRCACFVPCLSAGTDMKQFPTAGHLLS